jgi:hypothetical protein
MAAGGLTAAVGVFLQANQDGGPWNQRPRTLEIAAASAEVQQPRAEKIRFVEIRPFDAGIATLALFAPFFCMGSHGIPFQPADPRGTSVK